MTRQFGLPRPTDVRARDQLQKTESELVGIQPLPSPYAPAAVTPASVGIKDAPVIQFLLFGDCGGVKQPDYQNHVAAAMAGVLPTVAPEFALIVGDLVYFNGDPDQWVPQFYEPYAQALSGVPIIAFPGNHDGDDTDGVTGSGIASFMANMCTATPEIPLGDPQFEYGRHTQTLPSCDWALELQALTIISVWSNVPSGGYLFPEQAAFLTAQLKAAPADVPVMVGAHHPPYSVDAHHGGSASMGASLDGCFQAAGRQPEIVVSGHVHDDQRFTRMLNSQPITYLVSGNGGYHNLHELASDATAPMQVDSETVFEFGDDQNWGFHIITAGHGKIGGEYVSVSRDGETVTRNADTF